MKFAIQVRADYSSKPGGDTALAKAFATRLKEFGHQAELITDIPSVKKLHPDVLLAFNLDQPLELISVCRAAREVDAKVAVYTLHHPEAGVRAYLASQLKGIRGAVARWVDADPDRYFHLMSLLRGVVRRNPLAFRYASLGRDQLLRDLAGVVDHLLVCGPSELTEIRQGFGTLAALPVSMVPHPVDLSAGDVVAGDAYHKPPPARHFFVAGRIESRKNQLSVLDVAASFPDDEFVFAGLVNETDQGYAKAFKLRLAQCPNCRWVGQLRLPALLQHIEQADAVLSPSWFEVMSLINLFAHALNTPVISACHTYDADLLGDQVVRYQPERKNALSEVLAEFSPLPRAAVTASQRHKRIAAFNAATWAGFDTWLQQIATSSKGNK